MIREFTVVAEITPNVDCDALLFGFANCVWLKALKNSVRNSMAPPSPSRRNGVRLMIAMSELFWPGPVTMPKPLAPKLVASPSSPITGQISYLDLDSRQSRSALVADSPGQAAGAGRLSQRGSGRQQTQKHQSD